MHTSINSNNYDHKVDSKIANTTPNALEIQFMLHDKRCDFSSKVGDALHAMVQTKLDIRFSMKGLGCFQTVLCELGRVLMHKLMCYLNTHPRTPLIFQRSPSSENRKIIVHWYTNESENFTFQNRLESFQGLGGSSYKLLRTSSSKGIQMFFGTY